MIYITGDIHGDPTRFSKEAFPEQSKMTKEDYVIVCGDFGLVWDQMESRTEEYWLNWLQNKPFTTLFVDGNHENHDRLDAMPVSEWNTAGGRVDGGTGQAIRIAMDHNIPVVNAGAYPDLEKFKEKVNEIVKGTLYYPSWQKH